MVLLNFGYNFVRKKILLAGLQKQFVHDAVKCYKETGGPADRHLSGRLITVTTHVHVQNIRSSVQRNPERSIRKIVKEYRISVGSSWNIVKGNLGLQSFKIARPYFLDHKMQPEGLEKACRMSRLIVGAR
ncbi:uncharacterized protein LOC117180649 [Belonocnema kinseyi]|uniref:uncharacterized protein LOC117180649 n=1 Tax=Belonocnema kinseyi TaxID=2817044 RepID=UPI00143CCA4A|nr:uncharacterized protein LOC117180649 [Belonocnema kinseyi]